MTTKTKNKNLGLVFDPINVTRRPPYGTAPEPGGQLFAHVFNFPDNKFIKERFEAAMRIGVIAGFNTGVFTTVLSDQPNLNAFDKALFYTGKAAQGVIRGAVVGGIYALVVTGTCKLRGDKDDGWNHFWGGFGFSSQWIVKGDIQRFLMFGMFWGFVAAVAKYLYIENFQFTSYNQDKYSVCHARYPEQYLLKARAPKENLKWE